MRHRSTIGSGSLLNCLNQFLTPDVWRQAQAVPGAPRRNARWSLHRLTFVLLALTWCTGDSIPECFETARAWYVACYQCRKRPGITCPGFLKALIGVPAPVLRALAAGVRRRIFTLFGDRLLYRGFHPFGCDGSRMECPRTAELEQRMGKAGKEDSAPTLWLTAIVHLRYGLLWAWRLGKGTASEQMHLIHLLATLPARSLLVTDAGYIGYELLVAMTTAKVRYLIRMSSRATLFTEDRQPLGKWRQGLVWYWPQWAQEKNLPPLRARLLRLTGKKADVWLLTDVLNSKELSHATASMFYRWRHGGTRVCFAPTNGRSAVSSFGRTVAQVHREAEGSLLAVQILLAHATWELRHHGEPEEIHVSARRVLVLIREDIIMTIGKHLGPKQRQTYAQRLQRAIERGRVRRSPKACRVWPRRKPHKPPKPPKIRRMSKALKDKADKMFRESWQQN